MLNTKTVERLASTNSQNRDCISLYLNYLSIKDLEKQLKSKIKNPDLTINNKILSYVDKTKKTVGSLAIFNVNKELTIIDLPNKIKNEVFNNTTYNLLPLYKALNDNPRFSVLLVTKNKAMLYDYYKSEFNEVFNIYNEQIKYKDKAGYFKSPSGTGGGIANNTNKLSNFDSEFYTNLVEDLVKYNSTKSIKYNVLVSKESHDKVFQSLLSNKTFTTFVIQADYLGESKTNILENSINIVNKRKKQLEIETVNNMIENYYPINKISINMSDILDANNNKKIKTLYMKDKLETKKGSVCYNCNYITIKGESTCPFCANDLKFSDNIIQNLVNTCIQSKTNIEFIHDKVVIPNKKSIFALKIY